MRRVLGAVLLLGCCLSAPAHAADAQWVAMGDSFSAGSGLRPYDEGTKDACARSSRAWPRLAGTDVHVACGGALVDDVLVSSRFGEPPQVRALTATTTLVTLTIGGNDLGYVDVLTKCVTLPRCDRYFGATRGRDKLTPAIDALAVRLERLYTDLRLAAPSARVVVVGYPGIVRRHASCSGIVAAEMAWLWSKARQFNGAMRLAAQRAGLEFLDTSDVMAGHELCTRRPWVNAVSVPAEGSFHPTQAGHVAIAARVTKAIYAGRTARRVAADS